MDEFAELETNTEKIHYVKNIAKKKSQDIKKVQFDKNELKGLEAEIEDMNDLLDMIGDESFDEFMEHEDFD